MGFLNIFSKKPEGSVLARLPSGSFTVDRDGEIVASTLPRSFPESQVRDIAKVVLQTFRSAEAVNLPLKELFVNYAGLKLTAKELRGGAIVFLSPLTLDRKP